MQTTPNKLPVFLSQSKDFQNNEIILVSSHHDPKPIIHISNRQDSPTTFNLINTKNIKKKLEQKESQVKLLFQHHQPQGSFKNQQIKLKNIQKIMLPQLHYEYKLDMDHPMYQFVKGQSSSSNYRSNEKDEFKLPSSVFSNGFEQTSDSRQISKKSTQKMGNGSKIEKLKDDALASKPLFLNINCIFRDFEAPIYFYDVANGNNAQLIKNVMNRSFRKHFWKDIKNPVDQTNNSLGNIGSSTTIDSSKTKCVCQNLNLRWIPVSQKQDFEKIESKRLTKEITPFRQTQFHGSDKK